MCALSYNALSTSTAKRACPLRAVCLVRRERELCDALGRCKVRLAGPKKFLESTCGKEMSRNSREAVPLRRRELEYAGPVLEVERDYKSRSALVEMKRCAQQSHKPFAASQLVVC